MKAPTLWSLLLMAMVLPACGGSASPPAAPPLPVVTVATPLVRGIVEWDRYTGRLEAIETVEVRARVSGYLESVLFEEGQLVEQGDLLAVIDARPFEAELARAEAAVEEARARLASADAQQTLAEAEASRASSVRDLARSRLANAEQALASESIAREQVDVRQSELSQADAALAAANARVAAATADISTAHASIRSAEAQAERARLDLGYTQVRASISGRISNRMVTRGNLIQGGTVGATQLTTIVSTDPVHVVIDANEQAFLRYMRLSTSGARPSSRTYKNPIHVGLIDEDGFPHEGHMDFVDNRIDPRTGTMRGRGILRNEDDVLVPGMFATVMLPGSARYDALLVPDAALVSNQSVRMLMVVGDDDIVRPLPVEPGPMVDGLRVIRSGLDSDQRVIISGLQRARPGQQVQTEQGEIVAADLDDGLPNEYQPWPEERWIRVPRESAPADAEGAGR